jgi:DNA-binding transcriptional LysR family regulator
MFGEFSKAWIRGAASKSCSTMTEWERHHSSQPRGKVAGPTFGNCTMALQAAVDGIGVAIGLRPYVEDDLAKGRLLAPFSIAVPKKRAWVFVLSRLPQGRSRSCRAARLAARFTLVRAAKQRRRRRLAMVQRQDRRHGRKQAAIRMRNAETCEGWQ